MRSAAHTEAYCPARRLELRARVSSRGGIVQEASWVRSVYLYLMCVASVVLVGFGAIAFMLGLVHTIAPDLGHRDTLDRVGIGLANIATEVVDVVSEAEGGDSEAFCRDVTDTDADFEDCMADQGIGDDATTPSRTASGRCGPSCSRRSATTASTT